MKDFFKLRNEEHGAGEFGTDELTKKYAEETPGQTEAANRYSPLQMAKAKKEREERRKAAGHDKETQAQRMRRKAYGNYMGGLKKESVEQLDELDAKTQKKFVAGAKAMKAYAQKNGGIDKADFMKAAKMMDDIARINLLQAGPILSRLNRFVDGLDTDVRERIYVELQKVGLVESAELPDPIIAEELKVSDGVAKWITDFKDSDAPQFQGKSDEEKKKMAIAAFMAAKAKEGGGEKKTEGYKSYAQQKAVWAARKDGGKGHPDNKKKKNEAVEHVTEAKDPPLVMNAIAAAKKALQQAKRELTVAKGKHGSQGIKMKANKAIKAIDMAMKEI